MDHSKWTKVIKDIECCLRRYGVIVNFLAAALCATAHSILDGALLLLLQDYGCIGCRCATAVNRIQVLFLYQHTQVVLDNYPSFYNPLSGTTWVSCYQKDKPFWILLKQT